MTVAWLFPGQDAFQPLTGCDWAAADPGVAALLAHAGAAVGHDLCSPSGRRRPGRLHTGIIQPLLAALCLGIAERLRALGLSPDVVAGASLGELPAWGVAAGLPPLEVVELAAARGAAMASAAAAHPGGMLAVSSPAELADALRIGRSAGVADPAADNGPSMQLISGDAPALAAIRAALAARPVPVVGPWHSRLMRSAAGPLSSALDAIPPAPLQIPMRLNDGGRLAGGDADIRAHLVRQLTHPVQWRSTLQALHRDGVRELITIGPGRVLRAQLAGFPGLTVHDTDRPESIRSLRQEHA